MKRAIIPIEISTVYIITMNLDSFVSVSIEKIYLDVTKIINLNNHSLKFNVSNFNYIQIIKFVLFVLNKLKMFSYIYK